MYKLNLKIADFVFGLNSDLASFSFHIEKPYDKFLCSEDPDIIVYGHYLNVPRIYLKSENKVFDSGTFWDVYKSDIKTVFVLKEPFHNNHQYCLAVFDPNYQNGNVYVLRKSPDILPHPLAFPLFHLLMISLLSKGYGVLVHACGIDDNGNGYLFPGSSTNGKTTMARLWKDEAVVLNDERIVLRQNEGSIWIYGTPWHGEYEGFSPHGVPLNKIFFLHHAETNNISLMKGSSATLRLLTHCFLPYWETEGLQFTVDFCAKLVETIPCYELGFVPDKSIIDFIRCVK